MNPYLFVVLTCLASGFVAVWLRRFLLRRFRNKRRQARMRAVNPRAQRLRSEFVAYFGLTIAMMALVLGDLSSARTGHTPFVVLYGLVLISCSFWAISSGRAWLRARAEAAEVESAPVASDADAEHPDVGEPVE